MRWGTVETARKILTLLRLPTCLSGMCQVLLSLEKKTWSITPNPFASVSPHSVNFDHFKLLRSVGKGAFGKVSQNESACSLVMMFRDGNMLVVHPPFTRVWMRRLSCKACCSFRMPLRPGGRGWAGSLLVQHVKNVRTHTHAGLHCHEAGHEEAVRDEVHEQGADIAREGAQERVQRAHHIGAAQPPPDGQPVVRVPSMRGPLFPLSFPMEVIA